MRGGGYFFAGLLTLPAADAIIKTQRAMTNGQLVWFRIWKAKCLAKSSLARVAVLLFYSNRNGISTNMYR